MAAAVPEVTPDRFKIKPPSLWLPVTKFKVPNVAAEAPPVHHKPPARRRRTGYYRRQESVQPLESIPG